MSTSAVPQAATSAARPATVSAAASGAEMAWSDPLTRAADSGRDARRPGGRRRRRGACAPVVPRRLERIRLWRCVLSSVTRPHSRGSRLETCRGEKRKWAQRRWFPSVDRSVSPVEKDVRRCPSGAGYFFPVVGLTLLGAIITFLSPPLKDE